MLIAQITDTHITRAGKQARFLSDTVTWINAMRPRPDAVLLTGDTCDNGAGEQYGILRDILAGCETPVYVVPGNHDRRGPLRAVLPATYFPNVAGERLRFAIDTLPVRLIGLDTSMRGCVGGILDTADLAWLDATLRAAPERPALLFMHHPPFRTGVNAADAFGFTGLGGLRTIVARHPVVRRIIAGHIHCERRANLAQAVASSSVSTALQRVPELFESRILGLRPEAPGFTTHAWSNAAFVSTTYVNSGRGSFAERAPRAS